MSETLSGGDSVPLISNVGGAADPGATVPAAAAGGAAAGSAFAGSAEAPFKFLSSCCFLFFGGMSLNEGKRRCSN